MMILLLVFVHSFIHIYYYVMCYFLILNNYYYEFQYIYIFFFHENVSMYFLCLELKSFWRNFSIEKQNKTKKQPHI